MTSVRPPIQIQWLVDAAGEAATLRLLEAAGGTRVSVPQRAAGSRLARAYGEPIAAALVARYGGEAVKLPLCRHWRARVLQASGLTVPDIQRHLGVSRSTVQRLLQGVERPSREAFVTLRNDPAQMRLFDGD